MRAKLPSSIHIRYHQGSIELSGAVYQRLTIAAEDLVEDLMDQVSDRMVDLICISAGTYAVDRITKRNKATCNETGIRTFVICFHVADINYWNQPAVVDRLCEMLRFLSGDCWLLSFVHHDRPLHQQQSSLALGDPPKPSRIALYSGGLDSAAGLACQLLRGQRDLLVLTIGQQSTISRGCVDQINGLRNMLPQAASLYHASFVVHLDHAESMRRQEQTQRVRGFLFCTSAAIVAAALGIQEIDIYENGPGAINLPLMAGALSDGLTTRGANPGFLSKMSKFISDALEGKITFHLPFIDATKASMLAELTTTPFLTSWVQQSRSCVHTSWREPGITHCGRCPACIERRQAFLAAGVVDTTRYSKDIFALADPLRIDYLRAYLDSAVAWVRGDDAVHSRLKDHLILSDLEDLVMPDLEALYRKHAAETLCVYGGIMDSKPWGSNSNSDWRVCA